ncbi:hypothetical protein ACFQ21_14310 [Ohtaekwangia kribbensis]|jgi:hypothetical protein|uniref:MFS transporter n=1 Tax=Ohtaekwangia kribbensis TaxID=688913 RepID=A0ABW3K4F1_9BACT
MSKTFTSKQYFTQLNLIYFAQAGVMLIFTAVVFALVYFGKMATSQNETTQLFTYTLVLVVIAGFSAAHFLYNFQLSRIDRSLSLQKKMPKYLGVLLVRSACLELPGLLATIVFFMTGNFYLLLIPIFIAVVFFLLRPTPATISEDLNLTSEERRLLDTPDAIIAESEK